MESENERKTHVLDEKKGEFISVPLPQGMYTQVSNGKRVIIGRFFVQGDAVRRKTYPLTVSGYKTAKKELNAFYKKRGKFISSYGESFSPLSDDEMSGLLLYRSLLKDLAYAKQKAVSLASIIEDWKGRNVSVKKITFGELVRQYNEEKTLAFKSSGREKKNYEKEIRENLFSLNYIPAETLLFDITPDMGYSIFKKMLLPKSKKGYGYTPVSVNQKLSILKKILNYAVRRDYIQKNPLSNLSRLDIRAENVSVLSSDEALKCLKFIALKMPLLIPVFSLALFEGIRRAEICRLLWSDLFIRENGFLTVREEVFLTATKTKTNMKRKVVLNEATRDILKAWLNRQKPQFLDSIKMNGLLIGKDKNYEKMIYGLNSAFDFMAKNILRHTAASYDLSRSGNEQTTAHKMGHSREKLQQNYYNPISAEEVQNFYSIRGIDVFGLYAC